MEIQPIPIQLEVNRIPYKVWVNPSRTLLDLLRQELGLRGTKRGCDQGHCGACTVIMEDQTVNACLTLAVQADGKKITTIEGLSSEEKLDPPPGGLCGRGSSPVGFCTPGMILSASENDY